MTTIIAREAFTPIRGVYKIHQAVTNSYWLYLHSLGPSGGLISTPRIVFFGTSLEQVNHWIQSINAENIVIDISYDQVNHLIQRGKGESALFNTCCE